MKSKTILKSLLAVGALMVLGACTPTSSSSSSATSSQNQESSSPVSQEHVHSWKTSWEKDETHHWHECQDESCEVVDSKATHSWGEGSITKPATEEAEGEKTYTCSVCEATKVEKVDKLAHTHAYTVEKVDAEYLVSQATCENAAVYNKSCACGEKGTETFTYGEALNHNMVTKYDATHHWTECDNEGCDEATEKITHEDKKATCTEDAICSCGKLLEEKHHTWSEWTTKTPATCTEKVVEHRTCTVSGCNVEETRDGDAALDHLLGTPVDNNDGTHKFTCTRTGCSYSEDASHEDKKATCTEDATCSCGKLLEEKHHVWDEGTEDPVVSTEAGKVVYSCTRENCEETKEEDVERFYLVGKLIDKSWVNYESFDLYARRGEDSISIRFVAENNVFTSEGRNSHVELYFVTGTDTKTRIDIYPNSISTNLVYKVRSTDTYTIIDVEVPYTHIGVTNDEIFGINAGLWSEVDADWAPMAALDTTSVTDVNNLSTYVRCDGQNDYFVNSTNSYPLDIDALVEGYNYGFANPANVADTNADDFYLKVTKTDTSFKFDMIGFGTFEDNEKVKIVFHTSETDGSGWNIQSSDIIFLVSKTEAAKKTGLVSFWDYSVFTEDDVASNNTPVYEAKSEGYFTLSFEVDFVEIPEYTAECEVSFLVVEFWDANIYNADPWTKAMTKDGVGVGDAAAQSSYQIIQEKVLVVDKDTLLAGYSIQFSTDYKANITKTDSGLKLDIISFRTFGDNDFVRFVVDTDATPVSGGWALNTSDVSFTIYDDIAYTSTGNSGFWDLESNKFHSGDETINMPTYTQYDEYWTLSLFIQYDELGLNVNKDTSITGLLVSFHEGVIQNHGMNYGFADTTGFDIANQAWYFAI